MDRYFRSLVAAILAAALTACGGGGGSSPASVGPAPVTPLQPAAVPKSAQRAQIQSVLTTVRTTSLLSQFDAASGPAAAAVKRGVMHVLTERRAGRRVLSTAICTNMFTQAVTQTGPTTDTVTDTYYYDAACMQPREIIVANVTAGEIDGNATMYDRGGAVTQYETLKVTVPSSNGGSIIIAISAAKSAAAVPFAALGVTCNVNLATASLACGAADIITLANASMVGASLSLTGTDSVTATGRSLSINELVNAYVGNAGALSIAQGTADAWNVSGGMLIGTASISGTVDQATSGQVTSVALTGTDPTYNETVKLYESSTGLTATEVVGTTTLATATLDVNGNGTIVYADGSQSTVIGYTIVS